MSATTKTLPRPGKNEIGGSDDGYVYVGTLRLHMVPLYEVRIVNHPLDSILTPYRSLRFFYIYSSTSRPAHPQILQQTLGCWMSGHLAIRPQMRKGCWFWAPIISSYVGKLRGDQKAGGRNE